MENNTDLKEFRINQEGLLPIFQKDVYEYYLTVSKDVNEIEVEAVSENPNSKIQISGNNNLQLGENTIQIRVISPDENEEKIYSIQVTKTDNEEIANSNLEILAIENASLEPAFDSNITNYKTEVSNEIRNLNIFAVPENENAKIEMVVDHHKLSGIVTAEPIYYLAEPVGCTCTLMCKKFRQSNMKIEKKHYGDLVQMNILLTFNYIMRKKIWPYKNKN